MDDQDKQSSALKQMGDYLCLLIGDRNLQYTHSFDHTIKIYGSNHVIEIDYSDLSQIALYLLEPSRHDIIYCGEMSIMDPASIDWINHWLNYGIIRPNI